MPYGSLSVQQQEALRRIVSGRAVFDLGAGDLHYAKELLSFGAASVTAIDKEYPSRVPEGVKFWRGYFKDVCEESFDLVFVSWPPNWETNLVPLLKRATGVVYLGKNTDGNSCGTPSLFEYLLTREVRSYLPHRTNTLIEYGPPVIRPRLPKGEEAAALDSWVGDWWPYSKAEG